MKNPQITTKLNRMMCEERKAKLGVIACILDNCKITRPNEFNSDTFDFLYELEFYELNDILSDLISENYHRLLVMEACKSLNSN